ncbi:phytoene desaturase family protein [Angustibacter sp. McL0619]|uniref:phytoene desaturase family protein n=1 Tax=Angustibacter sp. McL0619 TaxID=3415676 RepID=UPI003CF4702E
MDEPLDAVVVGAGPNGLAAAVVLVAAGLQVEVIEAAPTIGGGARTSELTLPGFRHDVCSAVHPMGVASPFFQAFDLAGHGVEMLQPEVAYAQPLDGEVAALAWRDLDRTVDGLGADGAAWRSLLQPLAERWQEVVELLLSDFRRPPLHLGTLLRLGTRILEQGSPAWNRRFTGEFAPALLTGVSAHAISPPRRLAPAGAGLLLASLAHGVGWPIPRGGSQSIVDALAAAVVAGGGRIRTGTPVASLAELPPARAVLLDVSPRGLLELARGSLPASYEGWLRRFRYGGGVCKVDFALSAPVPWAAAGVELAGTLHLGGARAEMAATEADVHAGRHPERPFVLASQPGVVDAGRAPSGQHTLWTYAHVPNGSTRDLGEQVTAQVERFAPGFRDVVLHRSVMTAAQEADHNANYVGGDIASGAPTPWQMVMRPAPRWDPYRTPLAGTYLCSASTPPGPAVHGMAGLHAASRALRQVFGDRRDPLDLVRALP